MTKPKKATQKTIKSMQGFKATNAQMQCRGFQFELDKWYECEGELIECENGFHFCEQPSGVFAYYSDSGTRVFRVEAEDVLETPFRPGTDYKRVARRIRLVSEVEITGDWNTGNRNTGDWNTGDCNTGNWNAGDWNTGDWNTGDCNTGNRNTGDCNTGNRNTGNRNTGDCNTGNWNTGDCNTGDWNTGDCNAGDWNTGDWNTGNWNATNYSAGYFCAVEPNVICFDTDTGMQRAEFQNEFGNLACELGAALQADTPIKFERFAALPGITAKKLKALRKKMKAARQND